MEEEIDEVVRKYGWYGASINDAAPPFLYSIGLMRTCNHPEFIVFGLEPDSGHALLSGLVDRIRAGQSFTQPAVCTVPIGGQDSPVSRCRGPAAGVAS
jgi:Domain of unknown function (DUF4262)